MRAPACERRRGLEHGRSKGTACTATQMRLRFWRGTKSPERRHSQWKEMLNFTWRSVQIKVSFSSVQVHGPPELRTLDLEKDACEVRRTHANRKRKWVFETLHHPKWPSGLSPAAPSGLQTSRGQDGLSGELTRLRRRVMNVPPQNRRGRRTSATSSGGGGSSLSAGGCRTHAYRGPCG